MPNKRKPTNTASSVKSKEIIAEFQRIHPYLHTHFAAVLERIATLLAFVGFVIGNTSLVGTFLRNQLHITTLDPLITRPIAAACFILLSLGLLLTFTKKRHIAIAFAIYLVGTLSFILITIGLLIHFQWLQHILYPQLSYISPATLTSWLRVTPNAGFTLLFLSLALLFLQSQQTIYISQMFTLIGIVILVPTDIGFLYGSNFIYSISTSTRLLLISAIGLNALSISLLFARSHQGIMRGITEQTTGGFFARRFVFLAIAAPIILGWISLFGYTQHWYAANTRFLIIVTTTIATFLIWAVFIARSLQSLDATRRVIQNNIIFLSEASKILSSSFNYTSSLRKVAELSVMQFADWCSIELITPDNKQKLLVLEHTERRKRKWATTLSKRKDLQTLIHNNKLTEITKSGKSQFYPKIASTQLIAKTQTKSEKQLFQRFPATSAIQTPIRVQGKTIGIIQFVLGSTKRSYIISDVHIAEELAARIALAIENTRLYRNAQEAIKIRDEFISMASHELKTPLTSLKVYTEVLLKQYQTTNHKTTDYLLKMDNQITNMTNLIKDLLDVSRIQVGKLTFHFERMNAGTVINDVVENFQPTVPQHKITINGSISHSMIGDKERLRQVIINLLTNAAKYSAPKSPINVILSQTPEYVSVAVQDSGIGIDKKYISKIFDRFFQVGSKKRANMGLGMGLYISSEIIRRHEGTISVQSAKGKGSTFTITLPLHTTLQRSS